MKKVIFVDRTYAIIKDSQEAALERKMNGTAKFRLNHLGGSDLIDPKEIRRVTDAVAGVDYSAEEQPDWSRKQLKAGKRDTSYNPNAPGYKQYLKAKKKLLKKLGKQ